MKKCLIIVLCICLSVLITACSQRSDINEPETPQSQSVNENPSAQTEKESHNEVSSSSDAEEKADDNTSILQSESSVTPESSPIISSNDKIGIDPFGLMGNGEIALFASDSGSGRYLELDKAKASEFLAKIDFSQFTPSDMELETMPPDAMVGQTGTAGNYIQIGMPHTNMLYIYDTQPQALLVGTENKYYDIPSDIYEQIKTIIAEF